jgi:hypothetical protein
VHIICKYIGERGKEKGGKGNNRERERERKGKALGAMYARNVRIIRTVIGDVID